MQVRTSFLTPSAQIELDVPDHLVPEPESVSTVTLGSAARSLTYLPAGWNADPGRSGNLAPVGALDQDGLTVTLCRQREDPRFYVAVWRLQRGFLTTFMDEPTSDVAALEYVVRRIHVAEAASHAAVEIALEVPLQRGDAKEVEQRDRLSFPAQARSEGRSEVLVLREELADTAPRRATVRSIGPGTSEASATAVGIRVASIGSTKAERELQAEVQAIAEGMRRIE